MRNDNMYDFPKIAQTIKTLAKLKNIKTGEMLDDLGYGPNTLSNMQHGRALASDRLAKIADYLGCSVDYLLGRDSSESASDPGITRLHDLLDQIPPDRYDDAETFLRLIIEAGKKR